MSDLNELQKNPELELLGIEELESRQEMALMSLVKIDGEGNSKCTKNDSCNTVSGCGGKV